MHTLSRTLSLESELTISGLLTFWSMCTSTIAWAWSGRSLSGRRSRRTSGGVSRSVVIAWSSWGIGDGGASERHSLYAEHQVAGERWLPQAQSKGHRRLSLESQLPSWPVLGKGIYAFRGRRLRRRLERRRAFILYPFSFSEPVCVYTHQVRLGGISRSVSV